MSITLNPKGGIPRKLLHLAGHDDFDIGREHARLLDAARHNKKRFIPALYQIVNVSPLICTPDIDVAEGTFAPAYWLHVKTNQPVIWNGFVWSHRADGSHSSVQSFIEGVSRNRGKMPEIFNGCLTMFNADGSRTICRYALGTCIAATTLQARPGLI
jgi:hypothetical protein